MYNNMYRRPINNNRFIGGGFFGPFILGMFMPLLGYRNLYFASAILALLIAVIYHFVHGRHAKREN